MTLIFPFYWQYLGLPVSRAKGLVVDCLPFSLVEAMIWIGLLSAVTLALIYFSGSAHWLKKHPTLRWLLFSGPVLLILMGLGQGAFPLSLAPTAWRLPLAEYQFSPPLPYTVFQASLRRHEYHLLQTFSPAYYESLTEAEVLVGCDRALDGILHELGLLPGRKVQSVKAMGPFTTVLGLTYGGPAFHDPFFGELAMIQPEDHPTPKYWRLMAICHEEAHAKGFTREMDAEILTQLALSTSADPRYQMLGDIMYLRKSGEKNHFPEYLRTEIHRSRDSLAHVESKQPLVNLLRKISRKLRFQNSEGKYGSRNSSENWNPQHPFFATVETWLSKISHRSNHHEP